MNTQWYFIAENSLRLITKNFDLDVIYEVEDIDDEIINSDYVMATGGMEHYVIFKDGNSLNIHKSRFIDSFMYINLSNPIILDNEYIAFLIEFED